MRILAFGTYDINKHPRVGVLLEGLRAEGDDVVEANEPLGFNTADRVAMLRSPWLLYRFGARLLARWCQIAGRARTLRRQGRFDAIVIGYMGHFDVLLARLLFPFDTIVLDLLIFGADTARDRGVDSGARLRLLGLLDRVASLCATVIVVDTAEQEMLLAPGQRRKAVVIPVGASASWFATAATRSVPTTSGPLRLVFFGLFTPLQGAAVIGQALAALARRPDITTTMIGTGQDLAATRRAAATSSHVTWIDWVDSAELPALVVAHDICLGIFGTSAKALRVVPNKVYQGLASGSVVVTSDTPPQRRALGDAAVFVPGGDPGALAEALGLLADDRLRVQRLQEAARQASAQFSPSLLVSPLRRRLAGAPGASQLGKDV